MRWLLILLSVLLLPASSAAQDCPDGTAEGSSPADAPCKLCLNGVLEPLPPRTICGDEERFECDATGAFREECVYVDPPNGDETVCQERVPKGPACPNGLACDDAEGLCRVFCDDDTDCRTGFECMVQRCVAIPAPDMGMPPEDMGTPTDMETGSGDMSRPVPDMERGRDTGADGSTQTGPIREPDGGCCAVLASSSDDSDTELAILFLVAVVIARRRHA